MRIPSVFSLFSILFFSFHLAHGQRIVPLKSAEPLDTEIEYLVPLTQYSKTVPLTVIHLKNSKWEKSEVEKRIRRTETIFAQCEWTFSPIVIISLNHEQGSTVDVETYEWDNDYSFFSLRGFTDDDPLLQKPAMFLLDSERADRYQGGVSFRRGLIPEGSPDEKILNFSLLFGSFAFEPQRSSGDLYRVGKYEVMAHELAHLLFDVGHLETPNNLLTNIAYSNTRTNFISKEQCAHPSPQFKDLQDPK